MGLLPRSFSYSKSFVATLVAVSCFAYAFPVVVALLAALIYDQWQDFPKLVAAFASPMGLGLGWLILSAFAIRHALVHRPVRILR